MLADQVLWTNDSEKLVGNFMNSLLMYLIFHHITQRAAVKEID